MAAKVSFFPVANGDMALVKTDKGNHVLIDINIRKAADDPDDKTPDVAKQLKDRLPKDSDGRPYVDAMLLSHPDQDHCRGLKAHFHLGPLADYVKDSGKIVIREMWSSPILFRRKNAKDHNLCEDAETWAAEARRRVRRFKDLGYCPTNERILILGEDIDGKTDDLTAILVKVDENWTKINGTEDGTFSADLLAPLPSIDEEEEEVLSKNNSSVISLIQLSSGTTADSCRLLVGGDAEVAIWERLWDRHSENAAQRLGYDLLLAPHHCSWHSLSWDSWSELGEDAEVSEDARSALGQPRAGAVVVASSKTITDDDSDPPCIRAKREYKAILKGVSGEFICVADEGDEPVEFDVKAGGLERIAKKEAVPAQARVAPAIIGARPIRHG
ncbi:MAG: metallohydrolase [Caulobacter sp.]